MAHVMHGEEPVTLTNETMIGAMAQYITHCDPSRFQPMNANFGIMHLKENVHKRDRKNAYAPQSEALIKECISNGQL